MILKKLKFFVQLHIPLLFLPYPNTQIWRVPNSPEQIWEASRGEKEFINSTHIIVKHKLLARISLYWDAYITILTLFNSVHKTELFWDLYY